MKFEDYVKLKTANKITLTVVNNDQVKGTYTSIDITGAQKEESEVFVLSALRGQISNYDEQLRIRKAEYDAMMVNYLNLQQLIKDLEATLPPLPTSL